MNDSLIPEILAALEGMLRERVDELLKSQSMLLGEKDALRARVFIADTEVTRLQTANAHWRLRIGQMKIDAEAAEAHVVELAGGLSELMRWHRNEGADTDEPPSAFLHKAATVLAATPADALERYKALENCATVLRYYARNYQGDVIKAALARLDAIERPAGEDAGS